VSATRKRIGRMSRVDLGARGGMRAGSLAWLRRARASGRGLLPVQIGVFSDGHTVILDGRHRVYLAILEGDAAIDAEVLYYGPRGAVVARRTERITLDAPPIGASEAHLGDRGRALSWEGSASRARAARGRDASRGDSGRAPKRKKRAPAKKGKVVKRPPAKPGKRPAKKRKSRERSDRAKKGWVTRRRRRKAITEPVAKGLKPKLEDFEKSTKDGRGSQEIKESHAHWYKHKVRVRRKVPVRTYEDIITQIGLELGLTMGRIESYITS
jgi:hypothetical protein